MVLKISTVNKYIGLTKVLWELRFIEYTDRRPFFNKLYEAYWRR